jgi:AcrR family transcriptional regulator
VTQAVEGFEPEPGEAGPPSSSERQSPPRSDQMALSRHDRQSPPRSDQMALSRRDRLRVATIEEIIQTARRLLVASGPEAVKLRAIARGMGMTAPGLYRYFGSREELLRRVCANLFTELGEDIQRAIHAAVPPGATGDAAAHMAAKMAAACREFRRWSLDHKAEFALLFGVPLPGLDGEKHDLADECALMFAGTFFGLFLELWRRAPFPVPEAGELDPGLRDQVADYRDALGTDIPLGAVLAFLRCWTLLYGAVTMEVFGHMGFALTDPEPMFEITLGDLAALVGLRYPPTV